MKTQQNSSNLKSIFKKILLFSIATMMMVMTLLQGFANAGPANQANEYQRQVGSVVYSLNSISNGQIIDDLKSFENVAQGALTESLAAEIALRLKTAMELLTVIAKDASIPADQKKELITSLGAKLGEMYMLVIRQYGDDELNKKSVLERTKMEKVWNAFKKVPKEIFITFYDLVRFIKTGQSKNHDVEQKKVWAVRERMVRDLLGQDITIAAQEMLKNVGDISGERADDALRWLFYIPNEKKQDAEDLGKAEQALKIRNGRKIGHKASMLTLLGLSVVWTVMPVDFVGSLTEYTEATVKISDLLAFSSIGAIALIKKATGSFNVIPILSHLIEMVKNPHSNLNVSKMNVSLMSRLLQMDKKYQLALQKVGAEKLSVGLSQSSQNTSQNTVKELFKPISAFGERLNQCEKVFN